MIALANAKKGLAEINDAINKFDKFKDNGETKI